MIFLGNLTLVNGTKNKIGYINYFPMDANSGLGKTENELNQTGVLVDSIPSPNPPTGQQVNNIYVDTSTKEITYDYIDTPQTQEQIIANLQAQNAQMLLALVNGGLM